jgi:hypothetical protein
MNHFNLTERVFGSLRHTNEFLTIKELNAEFKKLRNPVACYHSSFLFSKEILDYVEETGTVSGYPGECFTKFIRFDIDRSDSEVQQDNIRNALADARKLVERLRTLGINDQHIRCYFTGKKGFNTEIPSKLFALEPSQNLNEVAKALALRISDGVGIDEKIYDKPRLFRIPNSIHEDTSLYKIPLTVEELFSLNEIDIIDLATNPKPFPPSFKLDSIEPQQNLKAIYLETKEQLNKPIQPRPEIDLSSPPKNTKLCFWKILNEGVSKTSPGRHVCALRLAKYLKQDLRLSDDICFSMLKQWDLKNRPPLQSEGKFKEKEIQRYIFDGTKYDWGCRDEILSNYCDPRCFLNKGKDQTIESIDAVDLIDLDLGEDDVFIKGLLCRGDKLYIVGREKFGKSLLVTNWGIALSRGELILGYFETIRPLRVLYLQSEVKTKRMQQRLQIMNSQAPPQRGYFRLINKKGLNLLDPKQRHLVNEQVESFRPDIVIFDPLFKFAPADLAGQETAAKLIYFLDELIEKYGIAIIIVHHVRKPLGDGYKSRDDFADAYGSTLLMADADSGIRLRRPNANKREVLRLSFFTRNDEDIPSMDIKRDKNLWFTILSTEDRIHEALPLITEIIEEKDPNSTELESFLAHRMNMGQQTVRNNFIKPAIEEGWIKKIARKERGGGYKFEITPKTKRLREMEVR